MNVRPGPVDGGIDAAPAWRAVARAVAPAVVLAALAMMASLVGRVGEPVEAVSPLTLGVALGASLFALVGASVLATARHHDAALLSAIVSILMIGAVLSLFSIGIVLLPLAIVTLVLLVRRVQGRKGLAAPLLAGPAVSVGLAVLSVIWVQPPLVECHQNGVGANSRPWWGSSSGSGEQSPSGGVATGSIETPSGRYVYRCEGQRLTEFRRR